MLTINNYNFGYKKKMPVLKNINLSVDSGFVLLVVKTEVESQHL